MKSEKQTIRQRFSGRALAVAVMAVSALVITLAPGHLSKAYAQSGTESQKALIVFFSRSGNTRAMADIIRQQTGADMVELQTVEPYPADYTATTEQAKKELESGVKPALSTTVDNIGDYGVVFVGSPSWWGTMAPPVRTFLTEYDLAGKTLIPFITHGGSGLGNSVDDLRTLCPDSVIGEGLAVRGSSVAGSAGDIAAWIGKLNLAQ